MKKLTHAFWAKAVAVFLCVIFVLLTVACFMFAAFAQEYAKGRLVNSEQWIEAAAKFSVSRAGGLIAIGSLSFLASAAVYVFLLRAAGRRQGCEQPQPTRLEGVPFDLLLGLLAIAFLLLYTLVREAFNMYDGIMIVLLGAAFIAGAVLLIILLSMTLAVRIKTRSLLRNNITAYVLVFLWRVFSKIVHGISLLWKIILAYLVFGILFLWLFSASVYDASARGLFFLAAGAMLAALCLGALQLKRLQTAAKALAAGDLDHRVDLKGMHFELKAHAEALNGIGKGMRRAVEERMKSERMKTDLIANVSHDLKTPLTNIVSYVGLLQKEKIDNETAKGYVEVLARQAEKLKKLTGDIVEASRASSGAMSADLATTDLKEILHQSLAEYAARLEAARLEPVVKLPEDLPRVMADGRLAWRVLDNLLNNACKYALPATRLYCEAEEAQGRVKLALKNISREGIGVSGDELMERFVRGDTARTSEGSGLGLSIAKSLMELQKGGLSIDADGDLFKATLIFMKEE